MVAVFHTGYDAGAERFLASCDPHRWRGISVGSMTGAGWRVDPAGPHRTLVPVGQEMLPLSAFSGAVRCLEAVAPWMLPTVHADDRPYLAQELDALLAALCAMVPGTVVNAPVQHGWQRKWGPEQWRFAAQGMGVAIAPPATDGDPPARAARSLISTACGTSNAPERATLALAHAAGVPFLETFWDEEQRYVAAHTVPDLLNPEHVGALQTIYSNRST